MLARACRFHLPSIVAAVAALLLVGGPARASRVRPLNLEQLSRQAERILTGRVIDARAVENEHLGQPVLQLTLGVEQPLKGDVGSSITIQMLDGTVSGLPRFDPGEEVLLFLHGTSALGLTSPVGLGQGKVDLVRDKEGRRVAVPAGGPRKLLHGVSPETLILLGTPKDTEARALDATTLLDAIQQLVERDRGGRPARSEGR